MKFRKEESRGMMEAQKEYLLPCIHYVMQNLP